MKKYAVIVAGGSGKRMDSAMPKQFLMLQDKPVIYHTLKTFLEAFDDMHIILVLPTAYIDLGKEIIDAYFDPSRIQITSGGDTRFDSVKNGLRLIEEESIIAVHDSVRCLVSAELLHRCFDHAATLGSAVPALLVKDSVRYLKDEVNDNEVLDRTRVVTIQTPQVFHSKILLPAFEKTEFKERFTDEATVVESLGIKISLVEGEETNIKITTPMDLMIAELLLEKIESAAG